MLLHYMNINRNIEVIPLGIKPNDFVKKSKKELGISENKNIFVTVGRIIRRKNLEELIEIFSRIIKELDCELINNW